jgi:hypothetical protein
MFIFVYTYICIHIYIYIYINIHTYIHTYIYIYTYKLIFTGSTTIFRWFDHETTTFADWLKFVSNVSEPPLVMSVSYGQLESTLTAGEMTAFEYWAIQLGIYSSDLW